MISVTATKNKKGAGRPRNKNTLMLEAEYDPELALPDTPADVIYICWLGPAPNLIIPKLIISFGSGVKLFAY